MSANSFAAARAPRSTGTAPLTYLRRFLALDAVVTGGNGLAYLALSGPLGRLLGIDRMLLLDIGAFLLLFGAGVGVLATRRQPPVPAVKAVIEANLIWPVLSIVALEALLSPTTAGLVWIPMQAATVAGFAALQFSALRAVRASAA
ncbi:hypothetical protein GCM10010193_05660 [Kitasatospora atroaurantiaca]|uniref:Integral membrane protein n=1 Tax=Kitasatospora atroaurantiaca TaxID=285545 RepID=A0A561EW58_9ACTN|nr:hypothetical protein [Kitasatospora atroaurantiaca]TWE19870.1 hypothetical protein FB465_5007 [Kitasatospora atroaurantiaca]